MYKNIFAGLAISNNKTKVKRAMKVVKELSSPVPPYAIVNKGHNLVFCINKFAHECVFRILGIFLSNEVKGYYLVGIVESAK